MCHNFVDFYKHRYIPNHTYIRLRSYIILKPGQNSFSLAQETPVFGMNDRFEASYGLNKLSNRSKECVSPVHRRAPIPCSIMQPVSTSYDKAAMSSIWKWK